MSETMTILQFIFSSFPIWLGTVILLSVVVSGIATVIKLVRG
jgi:hypothetical protein